MLEVLLDKGQTANFIQWTNELLEEKSIYLVIFGGGAYLVTKVKRKQLRKK